MTGVMIRPMLEADIDHFADAYAALGWHKPRAQYEAYYRAQQDGEYAVMVAEAAGQAAGYLLLKPRAQHGPFADKDIPEIVDFNVLPQYQRQGIGSALLDEAERRVNGRVTLGVGLHAGYGAAQRIYAKRGYVPDGSGVWYRNRTLDPYTACENDDDLVLYLSKGL